LGKTLLITNKSELYFTILHIKKVLNFEIVTRVTVSGFTYQVISEKNIHGTLLIHASDKKINTSARVHGKASMLQLRT